LNRFHQALLICFLLITTAGCGSNSTTPPAGVGDINTAGGNSRLKYKEEYKQMLGKDGKLLWKPSTTTKRPPGIPKS
jgi:hypothetical protein